MRAAAKRINETWGQALGWPIRRLSRAELRAMYGQRSLWRRIRDAFLGFAYGWRGDVS